MQKIIPLVIGTTNKGKFQDLNQIIYRKFPEVFKPVSLQELDITEEPEETGRTFQENSKSKAIFYAEKAGMPAIADDGGLEIAALGGEPGIHSRRWPGYKATDQELIDYALMKMRHIPKGKRTAKLTTCVSFYDPVSKLLLQVAKSIRGHISLTPSNHLDEGYPYKALFVVDAFGQFYGELSADQHEKINHRRIALTELLTKVIHTYARMVA